MNCDLVCAGENEDVILALDGSKVQETLDTTWGNLGKNVIIHRENSKQDGKRGTIWGRLDGFVYVKTEKGRTVPCYPEELEIVNEKA